MTPSDDAASRWRDVVAWLGDRLPDPVGSWLLRLADDSTEPWVDAEGRLRENVVVDSPDHSTEPRCVPLCGAVRAYGQRALDPAWWWKHEALCPMREHLRRLFNGAAKRVVRTVEGIPPEAIERADELAAKGDGETWEAYAHRLERRIRHQRDHIKNLVELRQPGDIYARRRIAYLERLLGRKEVALARQYEGLAALKTRIADRDVRDEKPAVVNVRTWNDLYAAVREAGYGQAVVLIESWQDEYLGDAGDEPLPRREDDA